LVPLYYLLRTSDLAREGITNSASYEFADHVYAGRPGGRFGIGYLLDALFLRLSSARAMRFRCTAARDEIVRFVDGVGNHASLDVLAVPCGLGREMFEAADIITSRPKRGLATVHWQGMDLDGELVTRLRRKAEHLPHQMSFWRGDALVPTSYGEARYAMIVSTGFTEFLQDDQVVRFFEIVRYHLHGDGVFFTSSMLSHRFSDYLLRNLAEIHTHYRSREHVSSLIKAAGFERWVTYQDTTMLQTIVLARP
jgi:hypothetical protein